MDSNASTSKKGQEGESEAIGFLEKSGWIILQRNFRSRRGEIDIIAERADTLVFVEVKTWTKYGMQDLAKALGSAKIGRIIETSKLFLTKHRQYKSRRIRYDVVLLRPGQGTPLLIEGAFDDSR